MRGSGIIDIVIIEFEEGWIGELTMFTPKIMTLDEIILKLNEFEKEYGYSTIVFYNQFQNGSLGDDSDFMTWAGYYHLYLTSLPIRQLIQNEVLSS